MHRRSRSRRRCTVLMIHAESSGAMRLGIHTADVGHNVRKRRAEKNGKGPYFLTWHVDSKKLTTAAAPPGGGDWDSDVVLQGCLDRVPTAPSNIVKIYVLSTKSGNGHCWCWNYCDCLGQWEYIWHNSLQWSPYNSKSCISEPRTIRTKREKFYLNNAKRSMQFEAIWKTLDSSKAGTMVVLTRTHQMPHWTRRKLNLGLGTRFFWKQFCTSSKQRRRGIYQPEWPAWSTNFLPSPWEQENYSSSPLTVFQILSMRGGDCGKRPCRNYSSTFYPTGWISHWSTCTKVCKAVFRPRSWRVRLPHTSPCTQP